MDGTEGDRATITRDFGEKLRAESGLDVIYIDERLTTVSAERMLIDADVRRDKRKKSSTKLRQQSYFNHILTAEDNPLRKVRFAN